MPYDDISFRVFIYSSETSLLRAALQLTVRASLIAFSIILRKLSGFTADSSSSCMIPNALPRSFLTRAPTYSAIVSGPTSARYFFTESSPISSPSSKGMEICEKLLTAFLNEPSADSASRPRASSVYAALYFILKSPSSPNISALVIRENSYLPHLFLIVCGIDWKSVVHRMK